MFARMGIILMLLLVFQASIIAEDTITIPTSTLKSILEQLKAGTKLVLTGSSEVKSELEKSEQNQKELQNTIEQQNESIQKQQSTIQALEKEQSELKEELNLSREDLSSLNDLLNQAENEAAEKAREINNLKITQGIQTAGLIVEGIVIVILGIILAGK